MKLFLQKEMYLHTKNAKIFIGALLPDRYTLDTEKLVTERYFTIVSTSYLKPHRYTIAPTYERTEIRHLETGYN